MRFESGGFTSARAQLRPPSVLNSTAPIPRLPAKAIPATVTGPVVNSAPSRGRSKRAIVLTAASGFQPSFSQ